MLYCHLTMKKNFFFCLREIFPHRAFIPKSLSHNMYVVTCTYIYIYMLRVCCKAWKERKESTLQKYLLSNFISHKMADNIILYRHCDCFPFSKSNADCFGFLFRFYCNSQPRKKRDMLVHNVPLFSSLHHHFPSFFLCSVSQFRTI